MPTSTPKIVSNYQKARREFAVLLFSGTITLFLISFFFGVHALFRSRKSGARTCRRAMSFNRRNLLTRFFVLIRPFAYKAISLGVLLWGLSESGSLSGLGLCAAVRHSFPEQDFFLFWQSLLAFASRTSLNVGVALVFALKGTTLATQCFQSMDYRSVLYIPLTWRKQVALNSVPPISMSLACSHLLNLYIGGADVLLNLALFNPRLSSLFRSSQRMKRWPYPCFRAASEEKCARLPSYCFRPRSAANVPVTLPTRAVADRPQDVPRNVVPNFPLDYLCLFRDNTLPEQVLRFRARFLCAGRRPENNSPSFRTDRISGEHRVIETSPSLRVKKTPPIFASGLPRYDSILSQGTPTVNNLPSNIASTKADSFQKPILMSFVPEARELATCPSSRVPAFERRLSTSSGY